MWMHYSKHWISTPIPKLVPSPFNKGENVVIICSIPTLTATEFMEMDNRSVEMLATFHTSKNIPLAGHC